jgi:hypothetical protein
MTESAVDKETLDILKMVGTALGTTVGVLSVFYRFFVPRKECELRHASYRALASQVQTHDVAIVSLTNKFVGVRRDVRWGNAISAAIAKHLNITIPEQPDTEE